MRKKILIASILFVLSLSALIGSLSQVKRTYSGRKGESEAAILIFSTPRSSATDIPFYIDGNSGWSDFKDAGNCTGLGTYSDPYIIQNLEIDGGGVGHCIFIENSDIYFRIENVTVRNSTNVLNTGIKLLNVSNCQLINNTATNNVFGIYLRGNNNTISGNEVDNNLYGGIDLSYSHNNTISKNTVYNNMEGISLIGDGNIVRENTVNNNSFSGIRISGISNSNIISGNKANKNGISGISLGGVNISVTNNTANNNTNGIYLYNCNQSTVSGNTVNFNTKYGIFLEFNSNNNILWVNQLYYNTIAEANDDGAENQWDNGTTGNFWGDYLDKYPNGINIGGIWDTPYQILGDSDSEDRYPPIDLHPPIDPTVIKNLIPHANFTSSKTQIIVSQSILFTSLTQGGNPPLTFQWDFGDDSSISTEINPFHLYSSAGNYTVTLTVTDSDGDSDTEIKKDYIFVQLENPPPQDTPQIPGYDSIWIFGFVLLGIVIILHTAKKR